MTFPIFDGSVESWLIVASIGAAFGVAFYACGRLRLPWLQLSTAIAAGLLSLWVAMPVQAQNALGTDVRGVVDAALERGRTAEESLRDWLSQATGISEAHREDARVLSSQNEARITQGMSMITDIDDSMGDAAQMVSNVEGAGEGVIYVAVSLTMPKEALRQLSIDAEKVGAKLVIRGLVEGSFQRTMVEAQQVFGQDSLSGLAIEPQVFRAFRIERVPTFIVAQSPVQPCETGIDCVSAETPSDRIAGNVSLAEALRNIAQRGDAAPEVAQAALARLEG